MNIIETNRTPLGLEVETKGELFRIHPDADGFVLSCYSEYKGDGYGWILVELFASEEAALEYIEKVW